MNTPPATIEVHLNGETRSVQFGQSLTEVIVGFGLPPQAVLIEHNGRALLRSEWDDQQLSDGDRLEILRIVAGG